MFSIVFKYHILIMFSVVFQYILLNSLGSFEGVACNEGTGETFPLWIHFLYLSKQCVFIRNTRRLIFSKKVPFPQIKGEVMAGVPINKN